MRKFLKDWGSTILIFFCGWIVINLAYVGIKMYIDETFYGWTSFFKSFLLVSAVEAAGIISLALIGAAFIWLIQAVSNGLQKEKKNEDKHRRDYK